jgi:hypothetical protein
MKAYKWTDDKIKTLEMEYYNCTNINKLADKYGITKETLKILCRRRGFKRDPLLYQKADKTKNTLKILLSDTIENWYWYGFIIGDGNLNNSYLTINLQERDRPHLKKLADILNITFKKSICVSDVNNINELKNKLGVISNTKTYDPVIINIPENKDLFFSYIVGLIDADGTIEVSEDGRGRQIKIVLHSSWYNNLLIISDFLYKYYGIKSKVNYTKKGYSILSIYRHKSILEIKKKSNILGINYLERKWDKLTDNLDNCNFFQDIENDVYKLYSEGNNLHKISKLLNVNYGSLFNYKKKIIERCKKN